jgi:hypothetical protein
MKILKKCLLLKLCFLLIYPISAWPQALPVAHPDNVNRAVSGVLQDGMRSRGFAANDPRFGNTLARATPYLAAGAATAAAVVAGTITAPAWASAAIVIGVGAVVNYVVNLALDSLIKWYFRPDGKIDESSDPSSSSVTCALTAGGPYWSSSTFANGASKTFIGCDPQAVAREAYSYYVSDKPFSPKEPSFCVFSSSSSYACGIILAQYFPSAAPISCPAGTYSNGTQCLGYSYQITVVPPATAVSLPTAISHIPSTDLDKPLNPAIIAGIANRTWQQTASQPGYDGLPYPASNPITPAEVITWTTANPTYVPTIRDFTAPNPVTTSNPSPWALPVNPIAPVTTPANVPNANTTNPASTNPLQNLGPDPATPQPNLEPTPTAPQILAPILSMLPSLRSFNATGQTGTCPKPTFDLVGKTIHMEAHCSVIDSIKPMLQAAMTFAWAAIALFIILSA